MKKIASIFALLIAALMQLNAQNPYAALGIEEKVLHYDDGHKEMFDLDSVKAIGYAVYSPETGLLTLYDLKDSLVAVQKIDPAKMARFLSVDPITSQYPELTPYQFASNTPIMAIDLDGLEMYYAANGDYLGKSGKSSEIRIVAAHEIFNTAKENLSSSTNNHSWLLERSKVAYLANAENESNILIDWGRRHQPLINNEDSEKGGVRKKEYLMQLFTKTLTDNKGNQFDVFMAGSTHKEYANGYGGAEIFAGDSRLVFIDKYKGGIDLEEHYQWKRFTLIHTHPGFGDSEFSNEWETINGVGGGGDIPLAIKGNYRVNLVTAGSEFISMFDPVKYFNYNPKGFDATKEEHERASKLATNKKMYPLLKK